MKVAAIIVTKGDQNLDLPLATFPEEWDHVVWDNGRKEVRVSGPDYYQLTSVDDLSVYGRYAAIAYTDADLIYVQDDDCVVSEPESIVGEWLRVGCYPFDGRGSPWGSDPRDAKDHVVCNMPQEFRHDFYEDHALVGFGAAFHRDAPQWAWDKFRLATAMNSEADTAWVNRTCDIVFTGLTPRVLVDVPKEDLPWAHHYDRMWKQPEHQAERARMRELVAQIR